MCLEKGKMLTSKWKLLQTHSPGPCPKPPLGSQCSPCGWNRTFTGTLLRNDETRQNAPSGIPEFCFSSPKATGCTAAGGVLQRPRAWQPQPPLLTIGQTMFCPHCAATDRNASILGHERAATQAFCAVTSEPWEADACVCRLSVLWKC